MLLIYPQSKVLSVLPWFTCRNPTNLRSMFLSLRLCVEINWKYNSKAFPRQIEGYYLSATFYILNKIWYHCVPSWGNRRGLFRTGFLYDWLVCFPCSPRDSQESSSTSQLKTINALALSFLYGPTLTSVHDYWKNLRLDNTNLCQQNNVKYIQKDPWIDR